jgi:hypothetical protein
LLASLLFPLSLACECSAHACFLSRSLTSLFFSSPLYLLTRFHDMSPVCMWPPFTLQYYIHLVIISISRTAILPDFEQWSASSLRGLSSAGLHAASWPYISRR